jgi:dihydroneopterin aldolase
MSDRIQLSRIHAFGYHGVFEHEAVNGQDFYVDLDLTLDLSRASVSDDLNDTIDYGALTNVVVDEIKGERVQLIERLAGRIADRIKAGHPEIQSIAVTVHKPSAPVSASVADIAVTITR